MKSLLVGTAVCVLLCGARVPEKEENCQVLNPEFIEEAKVPESTQPQAKEDSKIEWKNDPKIEDYEYYDKPNGVRVYRVKPCANQQREGFILPQVLNPDFL